jgi:Holliday junction resolvase RusA-like endonuclease
MKVKAAGPGRLSSFCLSAPGRPILQASVPVQPVPLHRTRVAVTRGSLRVHGRGLVDADVEFRRELQVRWRGMRLGDPLEAEALAVAMRFRGSSSPPSKTARGVRRRPDITNLLKAVEDAANGLLWVDDRQVRAEYGVIEAWGPGLTDPLVEVLVWEL